MTYATLAEARQEIKAENTVNAVEEARVYNYLRAISARIDLEFSQRRPMFMPWIEAREIRATGANINSLDNVLYLGQNLLALSGATVGGNTLVVGSGVDVWPSLASPARSLRLLSLSDSWYNYCVSNGSGPLFGTITGIWGFHRDYAHAWLAVDALAAAISASATTLTVADVDGLDPYARTPRISAGNLLKIDDEFLEVVKTDTTTNIVTVIRGANGSTAATHAISAVVSTWQVEEAVKRACARQAAFLLARRGSYEYATVDGIGAVSFPSDWLGEVKRILHEYAYD